MTEVVETIAVDGFRCERCAVRMGAVLEGHDGLIAAHGNLLGEITLTYDDDRTSRAALLTALARGGFRERVVAPVGAE